MVNALNRRNWIFLPLILAGINLAFLFGSVQAAVLKDIRVGEYEEFTRVVFELDTPCEPEQIKSNADGRLTVEFADSSVGLIRKIPIERSPLLKNIQIWYRKNSLSAVITLNLAKFKFNYFPLNDPPRIVLDIHPMAAGPPLVADKVTAARDVAPAVKADAPDASRATAIPQKVIGTAARETSHLPETPQTPATPPMPRLIQSPGDAEPPGAQLARPEPENTPAAEAGAGASQIPRSKSSRLQFYLVVGLVLITIVILVLLLLMLLSRRRWAESGPQLSAQEFFRRQDKHIESLNERIQEQFKRYEEA